MKKALIMVTSCERDRTKQNAARQTWIKEWGHLIDYKFLLGEGNEDALKDEWIFPIVDDYAGATLKTHAARRRALDLGYDYAYSTNVDVYIIVPRLLRAMLDLNNNQYIGCIVEGCNYLSGIGYWTSRQAMEAYCASPPQSAQYEDMWVGEVMQKAGIPPTHDNRYQTENQLGPPFPYVDPFVWQQRNVVHVHLGRGTGNYNPEWMLNCHNYYMRNRDPADDTIL